MGTEPEHQEGVAYKQVGPQVSGNETQVEEFGLIAVEGAEPLGKS